MVQMFALLGGLYTTEMSWMIFCQMRGFSLLLDGFNQNGMPCHHQEIGHSMRLRGMWVLDQAGKRREPLEPGANWLEF